MNNLIFLDSMEEVKKRLKFPEQMLGKGLDQPFNTSNSGPRKILYSIQKDHTVPLIHAEPAITQTGYETKWGDESSSIIEVPNDTNVVAIIPKFSFAPKHHYYMILQDLETGKYFVHERKMYEHTTESNGYMYKNTYIDRLEEGDKINKGQRIRESTSYDDYGTRCDGVNLNVAYIGTDKNMEDSVIISDECQEIMATYGIHRFTIIYNDNDIPLNIHGDQNLYKSIPDILEDVKGGIFTAIRRENKEYSYYAQDYNRLRTIFTSDEKFTVNGTVIDIDIRCNNREILANNEYYSQLKKYNDEAIRVASELIQQTDLIKLQNPQAQFDYDLQVMIHDARILLAGGKYINDGKVSGNTTIEVVVLEKKLAQVGDKVSDRFGGKGVISYVLPKELMPRDQFGNISHMIINQSTCVNRENPGQLFEVSNNNVNTSLVRYLRIVRPEPEESIRLVLRYLELTSPLEAESLRKDLDRMDSASVAMYVESILEDGCIYTSERPIVDNFTLDKLSLLYKEFPFIKPQYLIVPIVDSNGNIRYINSRRPIILAKKYMLRMKQDSEEKFSSTSLSATNIKNLNTRNKASKNYKALHSNTPIALGDMEVSDLLHVGIEYVVTMLMIHSVSPKARRLCEAMLTGDPFIPNIRLDSESTNRNVEIMNAYLKTKGLRLEFNKIRKIKKPLVTFKIKTKDNVEPEPFVRFVNPEEVRDVDAYYELRERAKELREKSFIHLPFVRFNKKE